MGWIAPAERHGRAISEEVEVEVHAASAGSSKTARDFIEQVMPGGLHLAPHKDKAATPNRKRNSTDVGNVVGRRRSAIGPFCR